MVNAAGAMAIGQIAEMGSPGLLPKPCAENVPEENASPENAPVIE